jgi:hypothetical protein
MFVCCECCVLSVRGLCDELITRPEESYRLWCVVVCDVENLKKEQAVTRVGSQRQQKKSLLLLCISLTLYIEASSPCTKKNVQSISQFIFIMHIDYTVYPIQFK